MFCKTYYPFELINQINSTNINVITNNIFRLIEKNGVYKKSEGLVFCVRYSKEKSKYVIDFGTKNELDIQGICLNNYNNLKSDTKKTIFLSFIHNFKEILSSNFFEEKFKLKSFTNRCAVFVSNNTEIYFASLCTMLAKRRENKKLKTKSFFFEINELKDLKIKENLCKKDFKYRNCLKKIERCKSFSLKKPKLKYKDFAKNLYRDNDWSVVYSYCLYLHDFINKSILTNHTNDNISFLVYDHVSKKIIKIPNNFYKKEFNISESVIESDNYLLLPKVY